MLLYWEGGLDWASGLLVNMKGYVGMCAWFLYALRCADGTLYAGVTTDLARRVAEHNAGRGARYTAGRRPVRPIAAWCFPDRGAAQRAESRFRRLPRARKLALAVQRLPFAGAAFCHDECAAGLLETMPEHLLTTLA